MIESMVIHPIKIRYKGKTIFTSGHKTIVEDGISKYIPINYDVLMEALESVKTDKRFN